MLPPPPGAGCGGGAPHGGELPYVRTVTKTDLPPSTFVQAASSPRLPVTANLLKWARPQDFGPPWTRKPQLFQAVAQLFQHHFVLHGIESLQPLAASCAAFVIPGT